MKFTFRFKEHDLNQFASRYEYSNGEDDLVDMQSRIRKKGFLTADELYKVAYWKSPRSSGHVSKNSEDYVQEITGFALGAENERSRIEALTLLTGVMMPTASVILHFFHSDPYPIIDYRALWSLTIDEKPPYNFEVWWKYVLICRKIAKKNGLDMRMLDRALWQYSKENQ